MLVEWLLRRWLQAPEIQQMYSLNMPVSRVRTKMREEFEKHRYVNNVQAVDVLLTQNNAEFQVRGLPTIRKRSETLVLTDLGKPQEMLNFWKQSTHVMKYFRVDEDENAKLPKNFISGFLEVRIANAVEERERDCHYSVILIWVS